MLRIAPTFVFAAALLAAWPVAAFQLWNDFRASALLPDGTVTVRVEQVTSPGEVHTVLWDMGGVQEGPLAAVVDGPATLEGNVWGPVSARTYFGFRRVDGSDTDLLSVGLAPGSSPTPADLTLMAEDPMGDNNVGSPHLDLTGCRLGTDGTTLYAALSNAGGGFPVNSGLTFFSYLLGIKNPYTASADTVFGMIHTVDVAGIIQPGLYQINGSGVNDLVKLGEITATEVPEQNTLILSCQLADLAANPVFQTWFDPVDPQLDVSGFTQRITLLGGVVEADNTAGAFWYLRSVFLDPGPNTPPVLTSLDIPLPGQGGFASVVYSDAEGHCPVQAEIVFDGNDTFPLWPQSVDYGNPVEYRSAEDIPPLTTGSWSSAQVRFSDDVVTVVEQEQNVSAVFPWAPALNLQAWPNPSSQKTAVSFDLPRTTSARIEVFDLAGRRVTVLKEGQLGSGPHRLTWDGRDSAGRLQPVGIYFLQVTAGTEVQIRKIALIR